MARIVEMTGNAFPSEFLLAAACCRWPVSEPTVAAIRSAAGDATDWAYFLRIVKRQRVAGLVHRALSAAGIPSPVAGELAAQAQGIARRNLLLAGEAIRLQRDFDAAGIPVLALKGASLAQLAYGLLTLKHGRDIDLLVPPDRALAAMQLLEGAGYALRDPASHMSEAQRRAFVAHGREAELLHRASGSLVELHWRLTDNPLLLQGIDAFSPSRSVALQGGGAVRTLGGDDLFAYLCVHGASHAWSRLKWLADLNALIVRRSESDIMRLYRHAQGRGAGLCAGQALTLCQRLLGLRLPATLDAELAGNRRVQRLAAIALQAMIGADAATELDRDLTGLTRGALTQFLLGQGWAFYAAQCRIVCIGLADVIRFPLPPSLYFLYPVLRFPSWIWRHVRPSGGAPSP